jgi:hypothetical protein
VLTRSSQKSDIKRIKTGSNQGSPSPSNPASNEDQSDNLNDKKKQAPRGAAARSQREKELREKHKERIDAATKRKGRAERRRVDGE